MNNNHNHNNNHNNNNNNPEYIKWLDDYNKKLKDKEIKQNEYKIAALEEGKQQMLIMLDKRKKLKEKRRVETIKKEELLLKSLCSDSNDNEILIWSSVNNYIQSIDNDIINPFGTDKNRMKELINDLVKE